MIHIRAKPLQSARALLVGPAPFFKVHGPLLRRGPGEEVIGRYLDQHWEFAAQFLSSFECIEPATLHFEDLQGGRSEFFGPFSELHFPNGSCYADSARFAEFIAPEQRWCHIARQLSWPVLVICAA